MTKIVENLPNLNASFKLKLIKKKDVPKKAKLSAGIYAQMKNSNRVTYNRGEISLKLIEEIVTDLFYRKKIK
jgi:hypothetical protein